MRDKQQPTWLLQGDYPTCRTVAEGSLGNTVMSSRNYEDTSSVRILAHAQRRLPFCPSHGARILVVEASLPAYTCIFFALPFGCQQVTLTVSTDSVPYDEFKSVFAAELCISASSRGTTCTTQLSPSVCATFHPKFQSVIPTEVVRLRLVALCLVPLANNLKAFPFELRLGGRRTQQASSIAPPPSLR